MVDDAVQVAALEPVDGRRRVPGLERTRRVDAAAPREAVGEDLVEHRVADPGRGVDGRRLGRHGRAIRRPRAVSREERSLVRSDAHVAMDVLDRGRLAVKVLDLDLTGRRPEATVGGRCDDDLEPGWLDRGRRWLVRAPVEMDLVVLLDADSATDRRGTAGRATGRGGSPASGSSPTAEEARCPRAEDQGDDAGRHVDTSWTVRP